jgi:hypothetical protein
MYITFHIESFQPNIDTTPAMSHKLLLPEIQLFIEEYDFQQQWYYIRTNPWGMQIFLNSGNRVDVKL